MLCGFDFIELVVTTHNDGNKLGVSVFICANDQRFYGAFNRLFELLNNLINRFCVWCINGAHLFASHIGLRFRRECFSKFNVSGVITFG